MAQPTMRADIFVPRHLAIAPYDVTLPLGICLATSYTSSKKLSSFLPDGFTDFNCVIVFFLIAIKKFIDHFLFSSAIKWSVWVLEHFHVGKDNASNPYRNNILFPCGIAL